MLVRGAAGVLVALALLALPGRAAALETCDESREGQNYGAESARIDGRGGEFSGFDAAPDSGRSILYHLTVRPGVHTVALPIGQCYLSGGFNGDYGTSTFSGFSAVATDLSNHSVLGRDIRYIGPAAGDLGAAVADRNALRWPGAAVSWADRRYLEPKLPDFIGYGAFRLDFRSHGSYVVRLERYGEAWTPNDPGGSPVDGPWGGFEAILQVSVAGQRLPTPKPPPVPPEPKPGNGSAYPGGPTPSGAAGCAPKVTAGDLEGLAACWRSQGDVARSDGRARINGIDLTPVHAGIAIRIDRRSERVSSTGPVEVRVGPLRLLRATIDWRSRTQVFSIAGQAGKKDSKPRFDVHKQEFLGLPISGSAEVTLAGGQTKLKVSVAVPEDPRLSWLHRFAGWSGELTAAATNPAGLVLDAAKVGFPSVSIGWIDVQDASLAITRQDSGAYHYDGSATIYPFKTSAIGLSGVLGWGRGDGYFKLGAGVEQLNRPLIEGFFLQKVAFAVQANPFGLSGSVGVTFGPQFRLGSELISSARLDGGLSYVSSSGDAPGSLELTGELEVLEAKLGDGDVKVSGGSVDVTGNATFEKFGYGFAGAVNGWFDAHSFDLEGSVGVVLPIGSQGGEAVLSARGVGACRRGFGPDVGFGYRWGAGLGGLDVIGRSCDLGPWREIRAAGAAQAGATTLRVPRTRTLAVQVIGQGAAPQVAFRSPDGRVYQPTGAPAGGFADARTLLFQDAATQSEYLAVDAPVRGTWRVEPLPGSVPIVRVRSAQALPRLTIRARVSGRGGRRTLGYRIGHLGPASVTFYEQGRGVRRRIATARRPRGHVRFRVAPGPGGRRRIVAVITRFGHPVDARRRVASYRTGRVRPPRPRRLRIHRRGTSRVITWAGPRGRYVAQVRTGDGRRLRYVRAGRSHRVVVGLVPRRVRVRVDVVLSAAGQTSRAARASGR